jgi:hypothetical protein
MAQVGLKSRHGELVGAEPPLVAGALAKPTHELAQLASVGFDGGPRSARQRLEVFFQQAAFSPHLALSSFLVRVSSPHSGVLGRTAACSRGFLTSETNFCD